MKKGFTLIELLVVATIIILLAGSGIVTYSQFMRKSRDERRKTDLENIRAALEMYRSDNDSYPDQLSDLTGGSTKYLEQIPTDPKDPDYIYVYSPSPSGCDEVTQVCTDYTLFAYLETGATCSVTTPSCGNATCNYCVGPYGKK